MAKGGIKIITKSTNKSNEVSGDQRFFASNGQVYSSLNDLCNALKNMDDGTYYNHVNGDRNDFSSWISGVFSNKSLASKVSKAKNRAAMADVIEENL